MIKTSGLLMMLLSFAVVSAVECNRQQPKTANQQQSNRTEPGSLSNQGAKEKPVTMDGEVKQLAAGAHCTVFESFVFVARDEQTYQALNGLQLKLPAQSADFFQSHAVIAAFLGQRRTGGFSIEIWPDAAGQIHIGERVPKGMVTMALTAPFKIVAIPVQAGAPLTLALDETWKERLRSYRVANGQLTVTGGFAGINQSSSLTGTIQIMHEQSLATCFFELKSNGKKQTELRDVASGSVSEAKQLTLTNFDSRALTGAIQSPFKATGQFANDNQELSLNLETVPSPHISDNFSATGSLTATAITPRPKNRAVT